MPASDWPTLHAAVTRFRGADTREFADAMRSTDASRQRTLFRQLATRFADASAGVVVQRTPLTEVVRLMQPAFEIRRAQKGAKADLTQTPLDYAPLRRKADALRDVDYVQSEILRMRDTFRAADGDTIRVLWSCESLATELRDAEDDRERRRMREGGFLFLAWQPRVRRDASGRGVGADAPALCGALTSSTFRRSRYLSTEDVRGVPELERMLDDRSRWLYVDVVVSTKSGAGRALVLHACKAAVSKKMDGVVALAFNACDDPNAEPASERMFESLGFEVLRRGYDDGTLKGTWLRLPADRIVLDHVAALPCLRTGRTARTADQVMPRCPA